MQQNCHIFSSHMNNFFIIGCAIFFQEHTCAIFYLLDGSLSYMNCTCSCHMLFLLCCFDQNVNVESRSELFEFLIYPVQQELFDFYCSMFPVFQRCIFGPSLVVAFILSQLHFCIKGCRYLLKKLVHQECFSRIKHDLLI
jgi:hypothetical protein